MNGESVNVHEIYLKTPNKDESFRAYRVQEQAETVLDNLRFVLLYQTYFIKVDFKSIEQQICILEKPIRESMLPNAMKEIGIVL